MTGVNFNCHFNNVLGGVKYYYKLLVYIYLYYDNNEIHIPVHIYIAGVTRCLTTSLAHGTSDHSSYTSP